ALGGQTETFFGRSGLGDMIATWHAPSSRNYQVGRGLATRHITPEELETTIVAEGVKTARIAHKWAQTHGVEMPITAAVYQVLYQRQSPAQALAALMGRSLRAE
ncbi:MAG: NAD(P)H-dependent glycerol-3-phosphate dehydrogenase, partial [Candidatus Margulisiibacteriota bacterium]